MTRKMKKTNIDCKRMKNLNYKNQHTARVTGIDFYKDSNIVLTSSIDQRLCLFKADGEENDLLHSLYLPKFPILSSFFSPVEDCIYLSSAFNNYHKFDMNAEKLSRCQLKNLAKKDVLRFSKMSPDGKTICFFDKNGGIEVINAETSLPIHSLKANSPILSASFTNDGQSLVTVCSKSDSINVWDLRMGKVSSNLRDATSFSNSAVALSPKEKLLAVGSESGVVSLYSLNDQLANLPKSMSVEPSKTFNNLVSKCTQVLFSQKTNLMFFSSPYNENSMKLVICLIFSYLKYFRLMYRQKQFIQTFYPKNLQRQLSVRFLPTVQCSVLEMTREL